MFKKKVHLKINKGAKGTTEPAEKLLPGQTSKSESHLAYLQRRSIDGIGLDAPSSAPFPNRCLPNTRQALRTKLTNWLDNSQRNGLFCVTGPVCVGKTAIAKSIADHCQETNKLGAALFCNRDNRHDDATRIIISLAYQLSLYSRQFYQAVSESLSKNPRIFESDLATQFLHLIAIPSKAFRKLISFGSIKAPVIIIDGLDHCRDRSVQILLDLVDSSIHSQKDKSPFKWLVFCRPVPQWRRIYLKEGNQYEGLLIDDAEAVRDVETIVDDGFRDMRRRFPEVAYDELWPPRHQQKLIAKAASGFYMYAQCVIQFIGDEGSRDPISRLRDCIHFLDNPLWPRENNPLSPLFFVYQRILSDAEPDSLPNTMQVLEFCAYSVGHEQPSALMLAQSLNMQLPTLYERLDVLYPVFASAPFDAPAASIHFFHSSFVDFLKYRVNPAKVPLIGLDNPNPSDDESDDLTLLILSPAVMKGSEIDSTARHPLPKCHRGTRKLMRERISTWLGDMNREEPVLWITGSVGAGKTTVVQNVAEHCQDTGCLGVAVFLSSVIDGDIDAWKLVPTLSYQLARQYPAYKNLVNEYLMDDPHILEKNARSQFNNLITQPLEALQKGQQFYSAANPLVIVLDGFDQYASKGAQTEFISLIAEFIQRSSASIGLLWIISCRPEPHLMKMMQKMTSACIAKHEEVAISGVEAQDEVEQMLRDEFYNIRSRWDYRFSPMEQWPNEIHWLYLRDKTAGFFMFASCILRYVADEDQQDPRAMLALALRLVGDALMPHSLHPFRTLDTLYEQVVVSAELQDNPVGIGILSLCVHHGARAITIQNILDVLHIDRQMFNEALDGLHSVMKIPLFGSNHERVEFYHPSFADFLKDPQRSGAIAYQIMGEEDVPVASEERLPPPPVPSRPYSTSSHASSSRTSNSQASSSHASSSHASSSMAGPSNPFGSMSDVKETPKRKKLVAYVD